jgi:hypothetical protein
MTITQMIELCKARLAQLGQLRTSAVNLGDIAQISKIDAETTEVQDTLNKLQTLV